MYRCARFDGDTILLIVMFPSLAGAMCGGNGEFYLYKRRKNNEPSKGDTLSCPRFMDTE